MSLENLKQNNIEWAERMVAQDADFFNNLSEQQKPEYLWIGCSDSRVPATQLVDLAPGEMFVHRNIANMVVHTDLNCMSVLQFAVEVLKVKHVIVCGHYGCGGVKASLGNAPAGLVDNWLTNIRDVHFNNEVKLQALPDDEKFDRMCELNVISQVYNVAKTKVVQGTWEKGLPLSIHGWIYGLKDGLIKDLDVTLNDQQGLHKAYHLKQG